MKTGNLVTPVVCVSLWIGLIGKSMEARFHQLKKNPMVSHTSEIKTQHLSLIMQNYELLTHDFHFYLIILAFYCIIITYHWCIFYFFVRLYFHSYLFSLIGRNGFPYKRQSPLNSHVSLIMHNQPFLPTIAFTECRDLKADLLLFSYDPQVLLILFSIIRRNFWDYGRLALVADKEGSVHLT